MDNNLSQRVREQVEQSRFLVAESHRQRRGPKLDVKEVNDIVLVSGLAAQENAQHLCKQFQKLGVKTTIGMLPGLAGYQVSIYRVGLTEAKAMLAQLGIEAQEDGK